MKPRARTFRPLLVACLLVAGLVHASPQRFEGLSVEVVGQGRPVLMIPGLNSGADTWRETCSALQAERIQCHLVHLPGFAGLPATEGEVFLPRMREGLLAYVKAKGLRKPAVVGHSLGGVLALQMAIDAPDALGPLVIVDSLPFMAAATNPAATSEAMRPMAEAMRKQMRTSDDATYAKGAGAAVQNMARDPARIELLKTWGRQSDRATTSQAMYELMTTDLRPQLGSVRSPTVVLGGWAAYKPYGSTKESTANIFRSQYAKLEGARVEMSEDGYHFLMWDDPKWVQSNIREFLAAHPEQK
ncbi:alpha/beta fold hydrolase [Lysobacter korlensis]|uniref:Alpha/beta fold hydrolase n=1 Tax=Lysobacter korlensis TaxID=553636 RepID=A0ABV6RJG0_9GAMM